MSSSRHHRIHIYNLHYHILHVRPSNKWWLRAPLPSQEVFAMPSYLSEADGRQVPSLIPSRIPYRDASLSDAPNLVKEQNVSSRHSGSRKYEFRWFRRTYPHGSFPSPWYSADQRDVAARWRKFFRCCDAFDIYGNTLPSYNRLTFRRIHVSRHQKHPSLFYSEH